MAYFALRDPSGTLPADLVRVVARASYDCVLIRGVARLESTPAHDVKSRAFEGWYLKGVDDHEVRLAHGHPNVFDDASVGRSVIAFDLNRSGAVPIRSGYIEDIMAFVTGIDLSVVHYDEGHIHIMFTTPFGRLLVGGYHHLFKSMSSSLPVGDAVRQAYAPALEGLRAVSESSYEVLLGVISAFLPGKEVDWSAVFKSRSISSVLFFDGASASSEELMRVLEGGDSPLGGAFYSRWPFPVPSGFVKSPVSTLGGTVGVSQDRVDKANLVLGSFSPSLSVSDIGSAVEVGEPKEWVLQHPSGIRLKLGLSKGGYGSVSVNLPIDYTGEFSFSVPGKADGGFFEVFSRRGSAPGSSSGSAVSSTVYAINQFKVVGSVPGEDVAVEMVALVDEVFRRAVSKLSDRPTHNYD